MNDDAMSGRKQAAALSINPPVKFPEGSNITGTETRRIMRGNEIRKIVAHVSYWMRWLSFGRQAHGVQI